MTCRIGQPDRCQASGCEFQKHFKAKCGTIDSDKLILPSYVSDMLIQARETYPVKVKKKCKHIQFKKAKRRQVYEKSGGVCYLCKKTGQLRAIHD